MTRVEYPSLGILLEWDTGIDQMTLTQLTGATVERRNLTYEFLGMLQRTLEYDAGLFWVDEELSERHRQVLGRRLLALLWRSSWPNGVVVPAETVRAMLDSISGRPLIKRADSEGARGALGADQGFGGVEDW